MSHWGFWIISKEKWLYSNKSFKKPKRLWYVQNFSISKKYCFNMQKISKEADYEINKWPVALAPTTSKCASQLLAARQQPQPSCKLEGRAWPVARPLAYFTTGGRPNWHANAQNSPMLTVKNVQKCMKDPPRRRGPWGDQYRPQTEVPAYATTITTKCRPHATHARYLRP